MTHSRLREHRLSRLLEVGRSLVSEHDHETVLRRVLDVARELTGARFAAIGILDSERVELERFLVSGVTDETHRSIGKLPRGRGILGELIREPKPLRLSNISSHPRSFGFPPGHPQMNTFLGAPIMIRGEAWGNLYLTEKEDGDFDEHDEESLVVLAEWAAIAIDNARLYERVEGRREDLERAVSGLEATTAIAQAVGGETDLDNVLELVAKRARALVSARSVMIMLADDGDLIVSAMAGEAHTDAVGSRVSSTDTIPGHVLRSGHVERLRDGSLGTHLGLGNLAENTETAMLVPLTFRGKTVGVLVTLDRISGDADFGEEDERLMRAFAASAATAVATAQSVSTEQLRLSVAAAEAERARWARELHDETLQGLGALQLLLGSALRAGSPQKAVQVTEEAVAHVTGEIERLQSLITELRPAALDDIGLASALDSLVERTRIIHGLEIDSVIDLAREGGRELTRLTPQTENGVYRIVQEGLNNVAKHAQAERVGLSVIETEGRVRVEMRDDGQGFILGASGGGFGLVGMRERVDLLAGVLAIESAPGEGTTVRADLPAEHRPEGSVDPERTG